jgi:hypothetical protein
MCEASPNAASRIAARVAWPLCIGLALRAGGVGVSMGTDLGEKRTIVLFCAAAGRRRARRRRFF